MVSEKGSSVLFSGTANKGKSFRYGLFRYCKFLCKFFYPDLQIVQMRFEKPHVYRVISVRIPSSQRLSHSLWLLHLKAWLIELTEKLDKLQKMLCALC